MTNVFVSYSHADTFLVAPVVKLLRVNKSLVFQDIDDIQPGKRWRDEIANALTTSDLVVVFWCKHASKSNEVKTEWEAAIKQEKDVLPLLLDATPLPSELVEYQWIDFQGVIGANHGSIADLVPPPLPSRWHRQKTLPERSLTAGWLLGLAAIFRRRIPTQSAPPPAPCPSPLHSRPNAANFLGEIERHIANEVEKEILRRKKKVT